MASIICTGLVNGNPVGKPFITVDPVEAKIVGDLVIISGTTNLAEGTDLLIQIENVSNTGAKVLKGTGGINLWSVPVDTSNIKPDEYTVKVTERKGQNEEKTELVLGDTTNTTRLVLTGTFLGSDTPVSGDNQSNAFIRLDPIDTRNKGEQFLVTGRTNLSVGTEIVWEVTPANLQMITTGELTGSTANSQVTKGKDSNRVSYALDTVVLNPGDYNVTVSTIRGKIFNPDMVKGSVSGSTLFALK
jgi:hypothetical protein